MPESGNCSKDDCGPSYETEDLGDGDDVSNGAVSCYKGVLLDER